MFDYLKLALQNLNDKKSFNFVLQKSGDVYSYYDQDNAVSLKILKSGWDNKYNCILECGEYETTDHNLYTSEQIQEYYGISAFLRKDKLNKINESTL